MEILMPQLGESVTEGTILKWLKQPGDKVAKYEAICEVSTDKVNAEVPSVEEGVIDKIMVKEGETVGVGQLICTIEASNRSKALNNKENIISKGRFSPAVLSLAAQNNIDLSIVKGTGAGGRIRRKDILDLIKASDTVVDINSKPTIANMDTIIPKVISQVNKEDVEVLHTPIRKMIATKMSDSKKQVAHAWTMMEVDVTDLVLFRKKIKEHYEKNEGTKLTFMPFFIQAVVTALKEYPYLNSTWDDSKIVLKKDINISVAMAKDDALYVPVIHNADEKNILGLSKAMDYLIDKVRNDKLELQDSSDGTFTVNNTGSFGSIISYPIVNFPQAAIISLEKIVKRAVVIDNMVGIRDMVNICLSFDHRILDGVMAGNFLSKVKEVLESSRSDESLGSS